MEIIRIDKVYSRFYHNILNKYMVICRCYINGQYQYRRLIFQDKEEADEITDGRIIKY